MHRCCGRCVCGPRRALGGTLRREAAVSYKEATLRTNGEHCTCWYPRMRECIVDGKAEQGDACLATGKCIGGSWQR